MATLLIKNATLVQLKKETQTDILIRDGQVAGLGTDLHDDQAQVVDATGKLVFPGFIDAHTHMGIPIRGTTSSDDFSSGSLAALYGGVTTIIDFTVQEKDEPLLNSIDRRHHQARGLHVDYSLHCNVTSLSAAQLQEIPEIVQQGIISFKAFTAYREAGMQLDDRQILDLLWAVKQAKGTVMFHAENGDVVDFLSGKFVKYNKTSAMHHALSRPAEAEIEAVSRILTLNRYVECPIYFVHLTTTESVQLAYMASESGMPVYLETCPQYLQFDQSTYERENGHRYIAAPPFRKQSDLAYLWMAIEQGAIDVVATDHCPFSQEQKDAGGGLYHLTPNGLPGVETMFSYLYSQGVRKDRLSITRLAQLISEEPARLFGLFPKKGVLLTGSDADLVIFNPRSRGQITAAGLHSNTDWSPYEGLETFGHIEGVLSRGKWLLRDRQVQQENLGQGEFVKALL